MVDGKILLVLKDLAKHRETLKLVKKEMKKMEKVENEDFEKLRKTVKDLRMQLKDMEDEHRSTLLEDDDYNSLREEQLELEESLAHSLEKLYEYVATLPAKFVQLDLETEMGTMKVQINPEMKVYVNGREEKKR
ncbi:hypothetical protein CVV38_03960 [Candidatus Peregrinibacteria bacterium HGW-Peregrinibacteria-1]|jgi:hypothetical protein|nr:MAG: hypothetical protein CVV38_03960 [Candidatus Peregrinibacteria bacterium HGW-Peregrinibacteria-1]